MQLRLVFLSFSSVVLLTACQAIDPKQDTKIDAAKSAGSQSARLANLAEDIEKRGESETAIALYQKAASLPDAQPAIMIKAGEAYLRAGYPTQAAQVYRAALAKAPSNGAAMLGLGSAMMEAGDIEAGIRALAQAAPVVGTSRAYNRLGVAQTFAGQVDAAQVTFAHALKLQPGDLDIETNMALAAALGGNSNTALPLAQKIAATTNAQLHHKRNVVLIYGLVGQPDQIASVATGLSTSEINTLLARAKSIRAKGSIQAKAKALGSTLG